MRECLVIPRNHGGDLLAHTVPRWYPTACRALVDVELEELLDLPASLALVGVGAREVDLGLVLVGQRGEGGDDRERRVEFVQERGEALDLADVSVPVPPLHIGELEEVLREFLNQ